jgi:archaellum component FlaF (FlaF/FlaG flagellin family)
MSEKKMVKKSVAISLGIICILLIAVIAYFSITGISAQNSYNNLQNQNKQLQNQVNNLSSIVNLDNSTVWVNNQTISLAGGQSTNMSFEADFAGFITISSQIANESMITVEVRCYFGKTVTPPFDQTLPLTPTVSFPVLPSSVEITISSPFVHLSEQIVTYNITYYY